MSEADFAAWWEASELRERGAGCFLDAMRREVARRLRLRNFRQLGLACGEVTLLLEKPVDPDASNRRGRTALHDAAAKGLERCDDIGCMDKELAKASCARCVTKMGMAENGLPGTLGGRGAHANCRTSWRSGQTEKLREHRGRNSGVRRLGVPREDAEPGVCYVTLHEFLEGLRTVPLQGLAAIGSTLVALLEQHPDWSSATFTFRANGKQISGGLLAAALRLCRFEVRALVEVSATGVAETGGCGAFDSVCTTGVAVFGLKREWHEWHTSRPSTPAMGCVRRVTGEAVMSEADFETWWQTSRDPAAPFVDVLRQHLAKRLQVRNFRRLALVSGQQVLHIDSPWHAEPLVAVIQQYVPSPDSHSELVQAASTGDAVKVASVPVIQ
ncbi:unnamed protein product [Effrenium voratum]|uniref:Uncharacterized protein n=1 Tax=Effrenium voratum TaxID=2562239 RepID=A0AA36IZC2_9DINO|nr:unnamed protein product [Effrenium voratum]